VAEFATNLFGEKFEWAPEDENRHNIIKGEKIETPSAEETFHFPLTLYLSLDKTIRNSTDPALIIERCYDICKEQGVPQHLINEAKGKSNADAKKFLYEVLLKDQRITELKQLLESGPTKLEDCIKQVIRTDTPSAQEHQAIISLVNIAVWARPDKESLPLLPGRYHLFVRAPEGIFVSFFPEPKIFLERHEKTEEGYAVFDLASCRRCGQEYLVGDIVEGRLKHPFAEIDAPRRNKYFLLCKDEAQLEEDEDEEVAAPEEIVGKGKTWKLCVKYGAIWEDIPTCDCNHEDNTIRTLIEIAPKNGILNKCYLCGLRSINIVREFIFQQDAPAAVLATALFQNLEKRR